jgi:hypothetical protein
MEEAQFVSKRDALENATFGKRVAEEESEILSQYFVKTEQWKRLIAGDVDIIYGPKGSGNSALYSLLTREFEKLRIERRIVGIPAENPRGTPAFRDLVDDPPASEEDFRQLWKFYLLSLLAEYIRFHSKATNIHDNEADQIIEILVEAGLLNVERYSTLKSALKRVIDFVKTRRIGVEGTVTEMNRAFQPLQGGSRSASRRTSSASWELFRQTMPSKSLSVS